MTAVGTWRSVLLPAILGPALLLGLWEVVPQANLVDARFFPPFSVVVGALVDMGTSGVLAAELIATLRRLLFAFAIAAVGGTTVGLLIGSSALLDVATRPIIDVVFPIPKIALLPFVLIFFGVGETAFLTVAFATAFFQIAIMTKNGLRAIDIRLVEAGRSLGAGGWRLFTRVLGPAMFPTILTAWRLGMNLCLITVIAVEFITAESGIGFLVNRSFQTLQVDRMYTGIIVVGALGHLINLAFRLLERWLLPWREQTQDTNLRAAG